MADEVLGLAQLERKTPKVVPQVKVTRVEAFDDDVLHVEGLVHGGTDADGQDVWVAAAGRGHVSWTLNFFENEKEPENRRAMTAEEARAYCESLLLEASQPVAAVEVELPFVVALDEA